MPSESTKLESESAKEKPATWLSPGTNGGLSLAYGSKVNVSVPLPPSRGSPSLPYQG